MSGTVPPVGALSAAELVKELENGCPRYERDTVLNCLWWAVKNLETDARDARETAERAERARSYLIPRLIKLAPANATRKTVRLAEVRDLWQTVVNMG